MRRTVLAHHPRKRSYKHDGTVVVYSFDSFHEYMVRAGGPRLQKHGDHSSGWGSAYHANQLRMAVEGDPAMVANCEEFRKALFDEISSQLPKPEPQYDVMGSYWDMDRYMEGDPECWIYEQPSEAIDRPGKGNLVRFVINTAASAGCFDKSHANRSGAIQAMVDVLQLLGLSVQFEIATSLRIGASFIEFRTIAKEAHQSSSGAQIAYWTSSNMERCIDFAVCETLPELKMAGGHTNYGSPYNVVDAGDLCFDGMLYGESDVDWNDKDSTLAFCKQCLINQGVVFTPSPTPTA